MRFGRAFVAFSPRTDSPRRPDMGRQRIILGLCMTVACAATTAAQTPVGTAFTYQGRLTNNGAAADGPYDFYVRLYDAPVGGNAVGTPFLTFNDIPVAGGLFTLTLDFGQSAFA